jgi:hypothetical protein
MALATEKDFISNYGEVSTSEYVNTSLNGAEIVSFSIEASCDISRFDAMQQEDNWGCYHIGTKRWNATITAAVPKTGIANTDIDGFIGTKSKFTFKAQYLYNNMATPANVKQYVGQGVLTNASLKFDTQSVSLMDLAVMGDGELAESSIA